MGTPSMVMPDSTLPDIPSFAPFTPEQDPFECAAATVPRLARGTVADPNFAPSFQLNQVTSALLDHRMPVPTLPPPVSTGRISRGQAAGKTIMDHRLPIPALPPPVATGCNMFERSLQSPDVVANVHEPKSALIAPCREMRGLTDPSLEKVSTATKKPRRAVGTNKRRLKNASSPTARKKVKRTSTKSRSIEVKVEKQKPEAKKDIKLSPFRRKLSDEESRISPADVGPLYCKHCQRFLRPGQDRVKNEVPSWCFTFKSGKKKNYMSTSHRCTNLKGNGATGNLKRSYLRTYKSSKGKDCPAGCDGLCVGCPRVEDLPSRMLKYVPRKKLDMAILLSPLK